MADKDKNSKGEAVRKLLDIPVMKPRDLEREIVALGYQGQESARRSACVFAFRHLQRLRRIHILDVPRETLPPRQNLFLIGPTGSGKTHLCELLFRRILKLPITIQDVTNYTERGYVGDEVPQILARLWEEAGRNACWAEMGIVVLDELDKLASRLAGPGDGGPPRRDVGGVGVQRELLHLLGGHEVEFHRGAGNRPSGDAILLCLDDISFVGCGTFSGLAQTLKQKKGAVGFQGECPSKGGPLFHSLSEDEITTAALARYGIMPELAGRMRPVMLDVLDASTLEQILERNVLSVYRNEFSSEGIDLVIDAALRKTIVKRAIERETGARDLYSSMNRIVEKAAFDFMGSGVGAVWIGEKDGEIVAEAGEPPRQEVQDDLRVGQG